MAIFAADQKVPEVLGGFDAAGEAHRHPDYGDGVGIIVAVAVVE